MSERVSSGIHLLLLSICLLIPTMAEHVCIRIDWRKIKLLSWLWKLIFRSTEKSANWTKNNIYLASVVKFCSENTDKGCQSYLFLVYEIENRKLWNFCHLVQ